MIMRSLWGVLAIFDSLDGLPHRGCLFTLNIYICKIEIMNKKKIKKTSFHKMFNGPCMYTFVKKYLLVINHNFSITMLHCAQIP